MCAAWLRNQRSAPAPKVLMTKGVGVYYHLSEMHKWKSILHIYCNNCTKTHSPIQSSNLL